MRNHPSELAMEAYLLDPEGNTVALFAPLG